MSVLHQDQPTQPPVTAFGPDFPFAYDDWLAHPAGLGRLPAERHGQEVAVVGGGLAGMVAAYELMRLGLKPVLYEAGRIGGRLRSEPFDGGSGLIAELGGMRFPTSSTGFYHYLDAMGLQSEPFPNPLGPTTPSTLIDLEGEQLYVEPTDPLPTLLREISEAWRDALEDGVSFTALQRAIRHRDVAELKRQWNAIVPLWDERTFYDYVASSRAFQRHSFRHREIFGQVGFGTGGWDSDFPNSMLEILRVVSTNLDEDQRLVVGGAEQLPRRLWTATPDDCAHWPRGTSLASLHQGAPRPGVVRIARAHQVVPIARAHQAVPIARAHQAVPIARAHQVVPIARAHQAAADAPIEVTDRWGASRRYPAVLVTCQSWLLTTHVRVEEELFSHDLWMALDRTRYMQSSKTFVMVDRPFWRDRDPETGRHVMSMTLTDRLTRGTYLFDHGADRPAVICLSYSWMSDALKVLPLPVEQRVDLMLRALRRVYPKVDIAAHVIGNPITVSWENDPNFLGAFKGALPGHYRYNRRMFCHFMQDRAPPSQRGIFLAGDGISWTPAWAEGAIQTALNAVWGIVHQLGGASHPDNPGPGDQFEALQPVALSE